MNDDYGDYFEPGSQDLDYVKEDIKKLKKQLASLENSLDHALAALKWTSYHWSMGHNYIETIKAEQKSNDSKDIKLLIAAAPELLHALQQIDSNAAESVEWIRRVARAAIAKAEGESL